MRFAPSKLAPACIALIVALGGCTTDADGVPKVADVRRPVVSGQEMRPLEFVAKYCRNKPTNETCAGVRAAVIEAAASGSAPRF